MVIPYSQFYNGRITETHFLTLTGEPYNYIKLTNVFPFSRMGVYKYSLNVEESDGKHLFYRFWIYFYNEMTA